MLANNKLTILTGSGPATLVVLLAQCTYTKKYLLFDINAYFSVLTSCLTYYQSGNNACEIHLLGDTSKNIC